MACFLLQATDRDYTSIADDDDTNIDAYPIVLIVVGSVIIILGGTGFGGAICGAKKVCRVILMIVSNKYTHQYCLQLM